MHISWARLAIFCHLVFISDPLIVSKFHNETHDPKEQENKIYTIVKGRETFYRRHTVPVTSCSEVKYVLKRVSFGSKDCTKELKLECAYFQVCFGRHFSLPLSNLTSCNIHTSKTWFTINPVLSGDSRKDDPKYAFKSDNRLVQGESFTECSG